MFGNNQNTHDLNGDQDDLFNFNMIFFIYFILQNYKENSLFVHYNGAYHSNNYEGILWYLRLERPNLEYGTISTVMQDDVHKLEDENIGIADFIICVDSDMTTTY